MATKEENCATDAEIKQAHRLKDGPQLSDNFKELMASAEGKWKELDRKRGAIFQNAMLERITEINNDVSKTLLNLAPNGVPKFQNLNSLAPITERSQNESQLTDKLITTYKSRDYASLINLVFEAFQKQFVNCLDKLIALQTKDLSPDDEVKLPKLDRAVLLLAKGVRELLLNKIAGGLELLHEAVLICVLYEAVFIFVLTDSTFLPIITKILTDPYLNCILRQKICKELSLLAAAIKKREENISIVDPILLSNELTVANKHRCPDYLTLQKELPLFVERIIGKISNNLLDSALIYTDLAMTAPETCKISCLLLAGSIFLQYMEQCEEDAKQYSIKCAIFECFRICFTMSERVHPAFQIYICRIALSACWRATTLVDSFASSVSDANLLAAMLSRCSYLLTVFPIISKNLLLFSDVVYLHDVDATLLQRLLLTLWHNGCLTVSATEISYFAFEGCWRGWFSSETEIQLAEVREEESLGGRFEAMDQTLISQNHSWRDVEDNLNWRMISRDEYGWIDRSKPHLNDVQFSKIHGFEIDLQTGELMFLLDESNNSPLVIAWNDIREVFGARVGGSIFSLDEMDSKFRANPFQQIRFDPPELRETNFLQTLLHTDYLLKFFTVGVEVSGRAPFPMRPISEENLLANLPDTLRQVLASVSSRKTANDIICQAFRFWIEAGEIPMQIQQEKHLLTVRLGDVPMCVKKHLLTRDRNGDLTDAPIDDPNDDSAEALFAREFTKHYDEIGKFFPEFLRLKELVKIAAIQTIIRDVLDWIKSGSLLTSVYSNLICHLRELNFDEKVKKRVSPENQFCKWVPTAYFSGQNSTIQYLVVGGVNLSVKLRHATVPEAGRRVVYCRGGNSGHNGGGNNGSHGGGNNGHNGGNGSDSGHTGVLFLMAILMKLLNDPETSTADKNWINKKLKDNNSRNKAEIPPDKDLIRRQRYERACQERNLRSQNKVVNDRLNENGSDTDQINIKSIIQRHIKARNNNWYTEREEPLGTGGFGNVFLCHLNENGSKFALKKIKTENKEQISQLTRTFIGSNAKRESLPKLFKHKNIINIYDAYDPRNGEFHIFMEYAPGGSLRDKYLSLKKKGEVLSDETIAEYIRSLIDAVEYLHSKKILHNDIKCDNIVFTADGTLKLTDFGLATTLKPDSEYADYCGGTDPFWAPEVAEAFEFSVFKKDCHSVSSDIWTIGMIMLEMKKGRYPKKILHRRDPLRYFRHNLSTDIQEFLDLCLRVDRRQRASIDDLKKSTFLTKY